jgi:adenosylmethionine-8-amino-7-oxononanoate aminotransferase
MHEPYLWLIKRLVPMMPDPSLDSFYFWNSCPEAVEELSRTEGRTSFACRERTMVELLALWR